MADIQSFYDNHIKNKTASQLADEIYKLTGTSITDGYAIDMNNAVLGKDVRDDIVYLSMLIRAYNDKVMAEAERIEAEADAVNDIIAERDRITDNLITDGFVDVPFVAGYYVSNEDGNVYEADAATAVSATLSLIRVPSDATVKIHSTNNTRIVRYYNNGDFKSSQNYNGIFDLTIRSDDSEEETSDDAAFIRIQYPSRDIETAKTQCTVHVEYDNGNIIHANNIDENLSDRTNARVSGYGNPLVLNNTSIKEFVALPVTADNENSVLNICGKNIVDFSDYDVIGAELPNIGKIVKNNVTFVFDSYNGTIRVVTLTNPANAGTSSASAALGTKYTTVNGYGFVNNFKFKFANDTIVSISSNCNVPVKHNSGVEMRVTSDGVHFMPVSEYGLTFKATGGVEYAIYFVVQNGWFGDVTFRPQIEIGGHITEFERFHGYSLNIGDDSTDNLFQIDASAQRRGSGYVAVFNQDDNEIYVNCKKHTGTRAIVAPDHTVTVGSNTFNYIASFEGDGNYVLIGGIPKQYANVLNGQITADGNTFRYDLGDSVSFRTEKNKIYYYRLFASADAELAITVKPYILRGAAALQKAHSITGLTTLYTNDNTAIGSAGANVIASQMRPSENITKSAEITKAISELTGGRITGAKYPRKAYVSFIDDDATNLEFVEEYYAVFDSLNNAETVESTSDMTDHDKVYVYAGDWFYWNGSAWTNGGEYNDPGHLVGGFAIETDHIEHDITGKLKKTLLKYEDDGFACLYHCKYQQSYTFMIATSAAGFINTNYRYVYRGTESGYKDRHVYAYDSETGTWTDIGLYLANVIPDMVVDTVAEMTNTNYIYMYLGAEAGYKRGHLYNRYNNAWNDLGAPSGDPIPDTIVNAAASMTDHKLLYLYNGNEDNYNKGHVYAWGNELTSWVDIGEFTGNTDPISIENTWYWIEGDNGATRATGLPYDEDRIRANFVGGLRKMMTYGFTNFDYWVTPYGANNEYVQNLAKNYGMKCLISYPTNVYFYNSFVDRYGNVGKWDIPRIGYAWYTEDDLTNYDERVRLIANSCVQDNGWLIVTTHVNSWPSGADRVAMRSRFRKLIMDLVNMGMEVVPFATGFETFKPYMEVHDLLK